MHMLVPFSSVTEIEQFMPMSSGRDARRDASFIASICALVASGQIVDTVIGHYAAIDQLVVEEWHRAGVAIPVPTTSL